MLLGLASFTQAEQQRYGLSEAEYNAAIDKVESIYSPIVASMGKRLVIDRDWTSQSNVALAMKNFFIIIPGGLARAEAMTQDALSLFVCHELGHSLGGAPKRVHPNLVWSSVEGQADYWATAKCLKRVFDHDDNETLLKSISVPPELSSKCELAHLNKKDMYLCIRSGMAGLAAMRSVRVATSVSFETPDSLVVSSLNESYPSDQCRLDTYLQGALCTKPFDDSTTQSDQVAGNCNAAEGLVLGARPLCWYKPSVE